MSEFPRLAPVWSGDPGYIVGLARKQLGLSSTDPDIAVLQRQIYAVLEDVRAYVGFDFLDPAEAPIADIITEACIIALAETYRRREASFGIVGTYSEDALSLRISSDWLAGQLPQLATVKRAYGLA